MFDLFLHRAGTKQIANALNDLSVPTRHGGPWSYSTVGQILANPVYMGKIRRGWSRQVKSVEDGMVKKRVERYLEGVEDCRLLRRAAPAAGQRDGFYLRHRTSGASASPPPG